MSQTSTTGWSSKCARCRPVSPISCAPFLKPSRTSPPRRATNVPRPPRPSACLLEVAGRRHQGRPRPAHRGGRSNKDLGAMRRGQGISSGISVQRSLTISVAMSAARSRRPSTQIGSRPLPAGLGVGFWFRREGVREAVTIAQKFLAWAQAVGVENRIAALLSDCDRALADYPEAGDRRWIWRLEVSVANWSSPIFARLAPSPPRWWRTRRR